MDQAFRRSVPFLLTTSGSTATATIIHGFDNVVAALEAEIGVLKHDWVNDPSWKYSNGEKFQLIAVTGPGQYFVIQRITNGWRENMAPPEKPHVAALYEHEFVMTPDKIDLEDGGIAMIVHGDPDTPENDPNRMAVRFHSWDETKEHEHLRAFAGKLVKITIEGFNV